MKEKPIQKKKKEEGKKKSLSTTSVAVSIDKSKKNFTKKTSKPAAKKTAVKKGTLPAKPDQQLDNDTMRLNRYLAHSGIAARRKADLLIQTGNVTVNGKVIDEMGYRVKPNDVVRFKGEVVQPKTNFVYILLNKPKDYITTISDEKGRKTVMQLIEKATTERVFPVGRLDRNTTGLLLFTNDGALAQRLAHPSFEVKKIYHATLNKPFTAEHFEALKKGVELEDGFAKVNDIGYPNPDDASQVGVEIHLGKNRIVRRLFEHFKYDVTALDRVMYGSLTKKNLPRSKWRMLTQLEVAQLKKI